MWHPASCAAGLVRPGAPGREQPWRGASSLCLSGEREAPPGAPRGPQCPLAGDRGAVSTLPLTGCRLKAAQLFVPWAGHWHVWTVSLWRRACRGGLAEQLLGQEEPPARREGAPCLVRGVCRVATGEAAQLPGAAWRPGLGQWCSGTAPLGQAWLMPRPPGLLPVAGRWWSSRVAECGRVSRKVHTVRPRSASTQAGSESFSDSGLRLAAALLEAVPGARHHHHPSSGPGPS